MMDDDDEASNITPKQALMGWVKSKLPPEVTFIGHPNTFALLFTRNYFNANIELLFFKKNKPSPV